MPSMLPMMLAAATPEAAPTTVAGVLTRFLNAPSKDWPALYQDLQQQGVPANVLTEGYSKASAVRRVTDSPWFKVHSVLRTVSAVASAYHGGKRNHGSLGWGAWWFFMGSLFPILTPTAAIIQGFAKPK